MKSLVWALFILSASRSAEAASPAEELVALKAEYKKRDEAAIRPVDEWFKSELEKREKAYLAAGKTQEAAAIAKERLVMLLCSGVEWIWETETLPVASAVFRPDGTGEHTYGSFKWEVVPGGIEVTHLKEEGFCTLSVDAKTLTLSGLSHGDRLKVDCRVKPKSTPK